jgi:hypothetical protein
VDLHVLAGGHLTGQLAAEGEAGEHHRHGDRAAERHRVGVRAAGLALVEEDHGAGSGGDGVLHLHHEVAGAALHEGDVARREAGEVLALAPGVGGRRLGSGREHVVVGLLHGAGDVAGAGEVGERVVGALDEGAWGRARLLEARRRQHLEVREEELLHLGLVAGGLELLDHVVAGGLVAGRARGSGAAVGVGHVLEGVEVLGDAFERHRLAQAVGAVASAPGRPAVPAASGG